MKNILNEKDRNEVVNRISNVLAVNQRLWGKMNANQMICHSTDQIRLALGEIPLTFIGNALQTSLLKSLVLLGMPAPKGKVETYKEIKQGAGGTPPTTIENDKQILINSIEKFINKKDISEIITHPNFGKLSFKQWGRLIYIHLDYHLKQFGV
ncbi:MAG: hypothetical protein NTX22_01255 [Ignavibacteriales bacterium]|nr:hypothetical protein [Ignavibacteriales bacterium]